LTASRAVESIEHSEVLMATSLLRSAMLAAVLCIGGAATSGGTPHPGDATAAVPDPRRGAAPDFFLRTRVYTFELQIAAADFDRMPPANGRGGRGFGGSGGSDSGYQKVPATLRFEGRDLGRVTVRYKGNSSYRGARSVLKRSLKIDFSEPDKRRFFGMATLNLNNNAYDPSQMRETLAYDVFQRAGVPAPRTAYARVFISVPGAHRHEYAGLFTVVEQVDQQFFLERWQRKVGVLVKPEGLHGLPDLGDDWKNYSDPYTAKLVAKTADAARLIAFVQFLNRSTDEDFAAHLEDYLDVEEFLRFLAAEVVLVNTDSPLAMNHNYWLTVHPRTHKVEWVPWDMNMAFGGFHNGDSDLSLYEPSSPGMFPLADRVLKTPALRDRYTQIVREMIHDNVNVPRLEAQMQQVAAAIHDAVAADPTASVSIFEANLSPDPSAGDDADPSGRRGLEGFGFGFGGHSGPPLRQFVGDRVDSVRDQLDGKRAGTAGRPGFGWHWGG
jgi:spore coat protein H